MRIIRVFGTISALVVVLSTSVLAEDIAPAEIVLRALSDLSNSRLQLPGGENGRPIPPISSVDWTAAKPDSTYVINTTPKEPPTAPAEVTVSSICDRILLSPVSLTNLSGLDCLKSGIRSPL
jgi:hypothetical protein